MTSCIYSYVYIIYRHISSCIQKKGQLYTSLVVHVVLRQKLLNSQYRKQIGGLIAEYLHSIV